ENSNRKMASRSSSDSHATIRFIFRDGKYPLTPRPVGRTTLRTGIQHSIFLAERHPRPDNQPIDSTKSGRSNIPLGCLNQELELRCLESGLTRKGKERDTLSANGKYQYFSKRDKPKGVVPFYIFASSFC